MSLVTILLVVLIVLAMSGGFYSGYPHGPYIGGGLSLILVVVLVLLLLGIV